LPIIEDEENVMSFWTDLRVPAQYEAMVAFYTPHWLSHYAVKTGALGAYSVMADYFAKTGPIIKGSGGKLIKTMGDGGLVVFPSDLVDDGVLALRRVQQESGEWFALQGYKSRVTVSVDIGSVVFGMLGSPGDEILDIFGKAVASAVTTPSNGFTMTPAVFRCLKPETRALFKKHTPPIHYIGIEDQRPRERDPDA
jgi:hypothetical protein